MRLQCLLSFYFFVFHSTQACIVTHKILRMQILIVLLSFLEIAELDVQLKLAPLPSC